MENGVYTLDTNLNEVNTSLNLINNDPNSVLYDDYGTGDSYMGEPAPAPAMGGPVPPMQDDLDDEDEDYADDDDFDDDYDDDDDFLDD